MDEEMKKRKWREEKMAKRSESGDDGGEEATNPTRFLLFRFVFSELEKTRSRKVPISLELLKTRSRRSL